MNKGTAYFLDGHKEIITEYNILENGQIRFKTESGEYLHTSNNLAYRPGEFVSSCCGFYKKTEDGYSKVDADRVVLKTDESQWKNGRRTSPQPNLKLSIEEVAYIRYVFNPNDPEHNVKGLAKKFEVDKKTIQRVINRETWR